MFINEALNDSILKSLIVNVIRLKNLLQHILPLGSDRRSRRQPILHGMHLVLRDKRWTNFFVCINLNLRGMIDCDQLNLIEISGLPKLFGQLNLVLPIVVELQQIPWNFQVLPFTGGNEFLSILKQAQRRGPQAVGHENKFLPVPCVQERT